MKRIIPLSPRRWLALEIFRRMKRERIEEHPLRQLFWECTLRCNVRCRHCGSDCKSSPSTPDMPLEDFLKVLDSIATHTDPHNVFVIISGGEPTVREDLETCAKEISRRGYPWGMVCNGLYLTRQRLHNLIRNGMSSISISLDGLEDVHNWMRRHPESFDRAVNAIREITAIPELTFDVITCVTRRSLPQLVGHERATYQSRSQTMESIYHLSGRTSRRRTGISHERRRIKTSTRLHPRHPKRRNNPSQLCLRRFPGKLRR